MSCPNPPKGTCPHLAIATPTVARRTILQGGVAGALALTVNACGMGAEPTITGPTPAGNVTDYAVGSLQLVHGTTAFIGRDTNGLYAMSAVCTHAGCLLGVAGAASAPAVACGCHGSQFDANGAVTHGPAARPLVHYQVDVASDGSITIQGGMQVDAATRTVVS